MKEIQLNKIFTHSNNRQIWRLLLSESDLLIIEERDNNTKEAFFTCRESDTGKIIFDSVQMLEKTWLGIEEIYKDVIYYNIFPKPDLPHHKEIFAFDIKSQKLLWQNPDYSFLFILDDKVYAFKQMFEGRKFVSIDYLSGEMLEDLGDDANKINILRNKVPTELKFKDYIFPEIFTISVNIEYLQKLNNELNQASKLTGNIEYVLINNFLFYNYHLQLFQNSCMNKFSVVDLENEKIIMEEILNSNTNSYAPDSFFIKKNYLYLLKEKNEVLVYNYLII